MFKDKHICYNAGVAQLCAMLDGKLFELPLSEHAGADAVFLSERQEADGTVYRFVSAAPPANAKPVRAGLEDVFLYVYREELGV